MELSHQAKSTPLSEGLGLERPATRLRQSARARLFLFVLGLTLVVGLIYTLLKPAEYHSMAAVLMTAPEAIDAGISEANVQSVAIQSRVLLGQDIISRLSLELNQRYGFHIDTRELASNLHVEAIPETNLVEISASGSRGSQLPTIVGTWIDVYSSMRSESIASNKEQTLIKVQEQLDKLAAEVERARDALARYRKEHNIISMERQDNEALARLDGLNQALNNAIEEEAKSRAYLETLQRAMAQGGRIVSQSERNVVEDLEKQLGDLRAEYTELTKRYTADYIEKNPQLRSLPARIEELEGELAAALVVGGNTELTAARQAHKAAEQTLDDLRLQLSSHKQSVAEFNTIYSQHQALVEDLASLEQLRRDTRSRLVQVEVNQLEKYPQVTVIEAPGVESERLGPNYLALVVGTLLSGLFLGIFVVWLVGFLSPKPPMQPAYVTLSGLHSYPRDVSEADYSAQVSPQLSRAASPHLIDSGEKTVEGESSRGPGDDNYRSD